MRFCLDYDGTYNRAPDLWNLFIEQATASGHEVICITMRHPSEVPDIPVVVYFTGRKAKARYAAENNIHVDVWIDDAPHWLFQDAG